MASANKNKKRTKAAAQTKLSTTLGQARSGAPLSSNRAPAADLSPWIARVYATQIEAPQDHVLDCGLLADTPILRMLFSGDWTAKTRDGHGRYGPSALFFGPQTKRMPVTVKGSFSTVGVALKPGAVAALRGPLMSDTLDRIILYDHIYGKESWGTSETLITWFDPSSHPDRWLKVAESLFRQLVERAGAKQPDPIVAAFDKASFVDPNLSLAAFAKEHAVERRRFERLIKKAYGQTAKQVLRRARVLDSAAHLLGVGDNNEEEEIALRYFDQSHMIREFKAFIGMTPRQFASAPRPLLTITLETRQSRRLEILGRKELDSPPPWRQ